MKRIYMLVLVILMLFLIGCGKSNFDYEMQIPKSEKINSQKVKEKTSSDNYSKDEQVEETEGTNENEHATDKLLDRENSTITPSRGSYDKVNQAYNINIKNLNQAIDSIKKDNKSESLDNLEFIDQTDKSKEKFVFLVKKKNNLANSFWYEVNKQNGLVRKINNMEDSNNELDREAWHYPNEKYIKYKDATLYIDNDGLTIRSRVCDNDGNIKSITTVYSSDLQLISLFLFRDEIYFLSVSDKLSVFKFDYTRRKSCKIVEISLDFDGNENIEVSFGDNFVNFDINSREEYGNGKIKKILKYRLWFYPEDKRLLLVEK